MNQGKHYSASVGSSYRFMGANGAFGKKIVKSSNIQTFKDFLKNLIKMCFVEQTNKVFVSGQCGKGG